MENIRFWGHASQKKRFLQDGCMYIIHVEEIYQKPNHTNHQQKSGENLYKIN